MFVFPLWVKGSFWSSLKSWAFPWYPFRCRSRKQKRICIRKMCKSRSKNKKLTEMPKLSEMVFASHEWQAI